LQVIDWLRYFKYTLQNSLVYRQRRKTKPYYRVRVTDSVVKQNHTINYELLTASKNKTIL